MPPRPLLAFQYEAYPRLAFYSALQTAREEIEAGNGRVVNLNTFSNKSIVFQVTLHHRDLLALMARLRGSALRLADPPPMPAPIPDEDGDVLGTLTLYLTGEDPDRTDPIPAVPG